MPVKQFGDIGRTIANDNWGMSNVDDLWQWIKDSLPSPGPGRIELAMQVAMLQELQGLRRSIEELPAKMGKAALRAETDLEKQKQKTADKERRAAEAQAKAAEVKRLASIVEYSVPGEVLEDLEQSGRVRAVI